jgi:replication-associated recombination protein RarA
MAEEAGSELAAVVREHLNKVKQTLSSRSNTDKTLKENAVNAVREMDSLLNKLGGMFWGLECTLEKAVRTSDKEKARRYSRNNP